MWLYLLCRTSASRCACLQGRGIFCHQSVGSKYKLLQDKCHCSVTFSAAFISDRVNVGYGSNLWSFTCTSEFWKSEAVCELFQGQVLAVLWPDRHSDSASDAQLEWGLVHGKLCHTVPKKCLFNCEGVWQGLCQWSCVCALDIFRCAYFH